MKPNQVWGRGGRSVQYPAGVSQRQDPCHRLPADVVQKAVVVDISACHADVGISEEFRTAAAPVLANLVDSRQFATNDFDTPSASAACRTGR